MRDYTFDLGHSPAMNPNEFSRLDARCENWARWSRAYSGGASTCGSAEGRYVAPRPDGQALNRYSREPVDIVDAEEIEFALSEMRATKHREVIVVAYYKSSNRHAAARCLHADLKGLEVMLGRAMESLFGMLKAIRSRTAAADRNLWSGVDARKSRTV